MASAALSMQEASYRYERFMPMESSLPKSRSERRYNSEERLNTTFPNEEHRTTKTTSTNTIHWCYHRAPEEEPSLRTANRAVLKREPRRSDEPPSIQYHRRPDNNCAFSQRAPEEEPSIRAFCVDLGPETACSLPIESPIGSLNSAPWPSVGGEESAFERVTTRAIPSDPSQVNIGLHESCGYDCDNSSCSFCNQRRMQSLFGDPLTASRNSAPNPSNASSSSSSSVSDITFDEGQILKEDGYGMPLESLYIDQENDDATPISVLSTPYFQRPTQDRGMESLSSPLVPSLPPYRPKIQQSAATKLQRNKLPKYSARVSSSILATHVDRFDFRPPDLVEETVVDPKKPMESSRLENELTSRSEVEHNRISGRQKPRGGHLISRKRQDQWAMQKIMDMKKLQACFQSDELVHDKKKQNLSLTIFDKTIPRDNHIPTVYQNLSNAIDAHPQSKTSPPLEFLAYFHERGMRIPVSSNTYHCNLPLLMQHVNIRDLRYQLQSKLDQEKEQNLTVTIVTGLLGAYLLSKGCHLNTLAFGSDINGECIQVQGCNSDKDNSKYVLRHIIFHLNEGTNV